ncbi:helix-turn-helix transcriptional regulator [Pantoea agglomerans]|uniref:helix-turn-helix transcriptional regulator n=1 Tax=Enterobacter agglomerans TaxID=549 RepID=UPI003C7BEB37
MDGHTSPARFLAYLLAEHDISVTQLCNRSGMDRDAARDFLAGLLPVTPALADQLGRVCYTPGFWLNRQALWTRFESDPQSDNDGPVPH